MSHRALLVEVTVDHRHESVELGVVLDEMTTSAMLSLLTACDAGSFDVANSSTHRLVSVRSILSSFSALSHTAAHGSAPCLTLSIELRTVSDSASAPCLTA